MSRIDYSKCSKDELITLLELLALELLNLKYPYWDSVNTIDIYKCIAAHGLRCNLNDEELN